MTTTDWRSERGNKLLQTELEQLTKYFDEKLSEAMKSPMSPNNDDFDGQYLFQFQEIASSLLKIKNFDENSLEDLLQIRCQIDSIKRNFEGSINLRIQLDKLNAIANTKLLELKKQRKQDFEAFHKTLHFELSPDGPEGSMPRHKSMKKLRESKVAVT